MATNNDSIVEQIPSDLEPDSQANPGHEGQVAAGAPPATPAPADAATTTGKSQAERNAASMAAIAEAKARQRGILS